MMERLKTLYSKASDWGQGAVTKIKGFAKKIPDKIKQAQVYLPKIQNVVNLVLGMCSNLPSEISSGIQSALKRVESEVNKGAIIVEKIQEQYGSLGGNSDIQ